LPFLRWESAPVFRLFITGGYVLLFVWGAIVLVLLLVKPFWGGHGQPG
jgi:hypothetical protein